MTKGDYLLMENAMFYTEHITDHITRIVLPGEVFAYLIEGSERAVLIDTGCGIGDLKSYVESLTDKPCVVLLSHGHLDHAPGAVQFEKVFMSIKDHEMAKMHSDPQIRYGFAVSIDGGKNYTFEDMLPAEEPARYNDLNDGDVFDLGGYTVEVLACPGHTMGSMTFLMEKERILLTGDACNPRTLVFGPAAPGLASYERSLRSLLEKTAGRYDSVLISHGVGQVASRRMVEENLEIISEIRAGTAENLPFTFGLGAPDGLLLAKVPDRVNEYGEVMANIAYDSARIEE